MQHNGRDGRLLMSHRRRRLVAVSLTSAVGMLSVHGTYNCHALRFWRCIDAAESCGAGQQ